MNKGITLAVALAVAALGVSLYGLSQAGGTLGVTNFNSLTLSDDLVVGDDVTIADDITFTAGDLDVTAGDLSVTAGDLDVIAGDLTVGNGTPDVTQDGEDGYIEGTFEVDGAVRFDGAVVNNSTTQLVGAVNLDGAVDLDGVVTSADGLEHIMLPTYATQAFTYTAAAGGTVTLFTVGAGEQWLVHKLVLEVTTDFDATGDDATIDIGDGNDADGFCVLADTELQAADTEGTGWAAGWQCQVAATRGVYQDGTGGFIYDGTDTIDAVIDETSGETITAGAATAHIWYTRIQ